MTTSVRMTPEQSQLIREAAALDNRTVNNFLITAAVREAESLLRRRREPKPKQERQP